MDSRRAVYELTAGNFSGAGAEHPFAEHTLIYGEPLVYGKPLELRNVEVEKMK